MRRLASIIIIALAGCGSSGGGGGGFAAIAATSSSSPTPLAGTGAVASSSTAATTSAADPTVLEIARAHAPLYRFHAWAAGDSNPQNKSEDYFPMSVARFFDALAAGRARAATREAKGATPGENAETTFSPAKVDTDGISGYPEWISGDAPGDAPVYVHAHEDRAHRVRRADGSGEDLWYVEYWLFYAQDSAKTKIAFITRKDGSHRADWELVSVAVALVRGPGGAFQRTELRRAFFSAHGENQACDRAEVLLADDAGRLGTNGEHPVAFIAQGKHSSYPEPGSRTFVDVLHAIDFGDYFYGNGFAWKAWRSELLDMNAPATPAFACPSLAPLLTPAMKGLADWRAYLGYWGPERSIPFIPSGSPRGPERQHEWGAGENGATPWRVVKAREGKKLSIQTHPDVIPAPVPARK